MSKKREELISFCGLFCESCHGYNGKIPDLARDLRKELRDNRYDLFAKFISTYSFGKDFRGYDERYKVLGVMVKFRCRRGCKGGGGSPFCKLRKCCQKKGIDGCWECDDFETCNELKFLENVHGNAHIKNLRKIKKNGKKEFIENKPLWYSKIK